MLLLLVDVGANVETWLIALSRRHKTQSLIDIYPKRTLRTWWREAINNNALREIINNESVKHQTRQRKWSWTDHTLRTPAHYILRLTPRWNHRAKGKQEDTETYKKRSRERCQTSNSLLCEPDAGVDTRTICHNLRVVRVVIWILGYPECGHL